MKLALDYFVAMFVILPLLHRTVLGLMSSGIPLLMVEFVSTRMAPLNPIIVLLVAEVLFETVLGVRSVAFLSVLGSTVPLWQSFRVFLRSLDFVLD